MPHYLAYSIYSLSFDQLEGIISQTFDFSQGKKIRDYQSWKKQWTSTVERHKKSYLLNDALGFAAYGSAFYFVKDIPTLEVTFRYKDSCPHCPPNFTGLSIWPGHSGSEGIVDMIEYAPTARSILLRHQIDFDDLSQQHL